VAAPIAAKAGVPHFCYGTSASIADGKYNFILNAMPADQAVVFADALQKRGIKKLALFTIKDTYTMAQRDALKKLSPQRGLEIVADFPYNADEKDFRTVVAKAKSLKPDLYVISAFTPTLEMLVRQMRDAGVTQFSGMETFDNGSDARMFDGLWYVGPANPAPDFTRRFKATFKKQMVVGSSHLYDSFMILARAFEAGGTTDVPPPSQVIANLMQIKSHTGVSGPCVYDGKGIFHSPAVEKIIKNGQPEELR
jgi:ABC-type branched-subunit amino acid transport system substrate-binding protein